MRKKNRNLFRVCWMMEKIGKVGYVPVWDERLHDVGKRKALRYLRENLALAFGVASGVASSPTRQGYC